jgi:hypothetical protein
LITMFVTFKNSQNFQNSQTQKFSIRFLVFATVLAFLFGSTACEQKKEEQISPQFQKSDPLKTQTEDLQFVLDISRNLVYEIDPEAIPHLLKSVEKRTNSKAIVEKLLRTYDMKTGKLTELAKQSPEFKDLKQGGRTEATMALYYRAHIGEGDGWTGYAAAGFDVGHSSKRIEAIEFTTTPTYYFTDAGILPTLNFAQGSYVHVQGLGNVSTSGLYNTHGTVGQSRRLEGVSFRFSPNLATDVVYRASTQNGAVYWSTQSADGYVGTKGQYISLSFFRLYAFVIA